MRDVCGEEEDFIRGITSAHFDEGELSFEFFEGKAVSVNRLKIADIEESVQILKGILEKNDANVLWRGFAKFGHAALKGKTADYVQTNKTLTKAEFRIWVEVDPKPPENLAHAEVMPRVPTGLARYLLEKAKLFEIELGEYFKACHKDDAGRNAVAVNYGRQRVLADASETTGLPRDNFQVWQITKEEYDAARRLRLCRINSSIFSTVSFLPVALPASHLCKASFEIPISAARARLVRPVLPRKIGSHDFARSLKGFVA